MFISFTNTDRKFLSNFSRLNYDGWFMQMDNNNTRLWKFIENTKQLVQLFH